MTGDGRNPYEYCAHCGDRLTDGEWYPVVTDHEEGTIFALYSFCDGECQTELTASQ